MNPSQSLEIVLVDESNRAAPIAGVFFSICFFLRGAYRFAFRTRGTDREGVVVVLYEDLERGRKINLHYQPADFKTSLDECDPEVVVRTPSEREMRFAFKTVHDYEATELFEDAEEWLNSSNGRVRADEVRVSLAAGRTVVHVPCRRQ